MDCSPPGFSVHRDSPGKNTGVGCHVLLQGIFPIQVSGIAADSLPSEPPGKPSTWYKGVCIMYKEGWALKNWCFQTVMLEKTLESLLDCKEIKSVNPKGNQPWIFIGRTDAEAEALTLWLPDVKSQLWKTPCCWERLRAGGEGGDRGWDGWMASLIQWTWV